MIILMAISGFCSLVAKGTKHMKFHFEIIICRDSGSVYNVHIFDMYVCILIYLFSQLLSRPARVISKLPKY